MLLDIYQIQGETQEFDKTALAFAQAFGTSPPSWFGPKNNLEQKENIGNGKNMIILDSIMKPDFAEKFKELPGVALTNAAKNNRIYRYEEHDLVYFGPRTGQNIFKLMQLFYSPENVSEK